MFCLPVVFQYIIVTPCQMHRVCEQLFELMFGLVHFNVQWICIVLCSDCNFGNTAEETMLGWVVVSALVM